MPRNRDEFSDIDKARIFARDRAICTYSGKSLWLLDYGAAPASIDWVDHYVPASRGGLADLDNGLCASWLYNRLKRDVGGTMPLFFAGLPTVDFYTFYETVPDAIAVHLRRFKTLHYSDWYFNRAVFQVRIAGAQSEEKRADGQAFARGLEYRSKAALKFLTQWRKIVERERPGDFASRELLPPERTADHDLLLSLQTEDQLPRIVEIAAELTPFFKASWDAFVELSNAETKSQALEVLARVEKDPHVVPRVKRAVRHNIVALFEQP
jgi:hypothetical protein